MDSEHATLESIATSLSYTASLITALSKKELSDTPPAGDDIQCVKKQLDALKDRMDDLSRVVSSHQVVQSVIEASNEINMRAMRVAEAAITAQLVQKYDKEDVYVGKNVEIRNGIINAAKLYGWIAQEKYGKVSEDDRKWMQFKEAYEVLKVASIPGGEYENGVSYEIFVSRQLSSEA